MSDKKHLSRAERATFDRLKNAIEIEPSFDFNPETSTSRCRQCGTLQNPLYPVTWDGQHHPKCQTGAKIRVMAKRSARQREEAMADASARDLIRACVVCGRVFYVDPKTRTCPGRHDGAYELFNKTEIAEELMRHRRFATVRVTSSATRFYSALHTAIVSLETARELAEELAQDAQR